MIKSSEVKQLMAAEQGLRKLIIFFQLSEDYETRNKIMSMLLVLIPHIPMKSYFSSLLSLIETLKLFLKKMKFTEESV